MLAKAKENRLIYSCLGVLLTSLGVYLCYEEIVQGRFVQSMMIVALGVSQFCYAYLSPHIFPRDGRAKEIIGKAMTVNFFILFAMILVLFVVTGEGTLGVWQLTASQVLIVLFTTMVTAIPGTMVVFSRLI